MDTIEFNKLDVLDQIEYINNKLGENLTLREVIERDLNLTRSTIRNRFKKYNYTYNKKENKYIYTESNKNITPSNITKSNTTYVKNSNADSIDYSNITDSNIIKKEKKNITENITNNNATYVKDSDTNSEDYNNIIDSNITHSNITHSNITKKEEKNITENITKGNITDSNITFSEEEIIALKELVAQNKNKKKEKIIDVCFTGDLTVKTLKIYNTVLEDYNKFVKKHKELKQQDIISLAIKEFLDKYK